MPVSATSMKRALIINPEFMASTISEVEAIMADHVDQYFWIESEQGVFQVVLERGSYSMRRMAVERITFDEIPNSFSVIVTDDGTVSTISQNDTLTLIGGPGVTVSADQQTITINVEQVGGGEMEGVPLFIQDTQPETDQSKYMWIQTNYQEAGGFTFWFEDGAE